MARREWAKKLNIDPYTTNPVLRPLLDKAATATFAGNFGVNATVGALVGPWQLTYEFDDLTRQSVWNNPAIDLEKATRRNWPRSGYPTGQRNLIRNKWFTPTLQTALVARIESLGKIKGIESVVTAATAAQGESQARSCSNRWACWPRRTGRNAARRNSHEQPGAGRDNVRRQAQWPP